MKKLKILCKIMITGVGFFYVPMGWHTILANSRLSVVYIQFDGDTVKEIISHPIKSKTSSLASLLNACKFI